MRKGLIVLLAVFSVVAFALPAMADVSFFGYARVMPTYYNNFDFDDSHADVATLNEGGYTYGEHIRGELRLGWKAGGDKWKIMMTAESDIIFNKNNVDRSFYSTPGINPAGTSAAKVGGTNSSPNAGAEFGIERAEFSYAFSPALELFTGWPISAVDIGTGGLLYGDDHPIFGFRGKVTDNFKYQLVYISIQNTPSISLSESSVKGDWRAYFLKPEFSLGTGSAKGTLSPILLFSDNRAASAKVYYYGLEGIGQFGFIKPSFEVIAADGEFRNTGRDIQAYAAFAGVELGLSKAFNPYIAGRYTSGDDNTADADVEGFVGITDRRVIFYDQGFVIKKKSMVSIPYNQIIGVASADEGLIFQTSEITLITAAGKFTFEFRGSDKAHNAYTYILQQILTQAHPQLSG